MKRTCLCILLSCLWFTSCGSEGADSGELTQISARPDLVVLITVDTLRADHLPMYGYPRDTAPFLSELAEQGVLFKNCVSASSHTAPSHATIFTALYPTQHGVLQNGMRLSPSIKTLASDMKEAGYLTGAFSSVSFLRPIMDDFDHVDTASGKYTRESDADASHVRNAEDTVSAALKWVSDQDRGHPIFLWVHLYDVHEWQRSPLNASWKETVDSLDASGAPVTGKLVSEADLDHLRFLQEERGQFPKLNLNSSNERLLAYHVQVDANYDSLILYTDNALRRLYNELQKSSGGRRGMWVFLSDHGEGLGSHNYNYHGMNIYREQTRVPLVIHFTDGSFAGTEIEGVVRTVDIRPTIQDAVGAPMARKRGVMSVPALESRTLLGVLRDSSTGEEPRLGFSQRRPVDEYRVNDQGWSDEEVESVEGIRYKYIRHFNGRDELFDLKNDPLEKNNLVETMPQIAKKLSALLRAHHEHMARQAAGMQPGQVDPEFLEELRQLGYLK